MKIEKPTNVEIPICKVAFIVANDFARTFNSFDLAVNSNNWNIEKNAMHKMKIGLTSFSVKQEKCMEYPFKYLIDSSCWTNKVRTDKKVQYKSLCENWVIVL